MTDEKLPATTEQPEERTWRDVAANWKQVGKQVRDTMIEISGKKPENIPPSEPIKDVRKKIKGTNKSFKRLDKDSK